MTQTSCQCEQAGFCRRHQCTKTEHWWKLCRTREDYFRLWEEGRGPGQNRPTRKAPGILRRAWNYFHALWRHLKNRRLMVSRNTHQARLRICQECTSYEPTKQLCLERNCGCYVHHKARWASEDCPLRRWPGQSVNTDESSQHLPTPSDTMTASIY